MCDNSKLPNQQPSVTRIGERGVLQIDEYQLLDGLLHNTSAEADAWISSQDQLPAATRQLRHIRDVVAAKVQNSQRLAQRPQVKERITDVRPKRPCEAAPCSLERGQLSAPHEGPQKVLRLAEPWSPGDVQKAQFLP